MTNMKTVFSWVGQVILFGGFLFFGITKFIMPAGTDVFSNFESFGATLQYITATLEVSGAILAIIPVTAALGAIILAIVMLGAIILQLTILEINSMAALAVIFLGISLAVMYLRKDSLWFRKR